MEDLQVLSHLGGKESPPALTLRHSPADSRAQLWMETDGSGREHSLETLIAASGHHRGHMGPAGMLTEGSKRRSRGTAERASTRSPNQYV